MSETARPHPADGERDPSALPVLAPPPSEAPSRRAEPGALDLSEPAASPVVAAAGGFVAGLVTLLIARVLRRHAPRPLGGRRRRARSLQVAGTRSFLVDVHLIKR